jgi:hypothetical protein
MQRLPDRISPAALGRLQLRMRGMLRQAGSQNAPEQRPSSNYVGGYRPIPWRAAPHRHPCLREAEIGETALSIEEIAYGRHTGEIQ